MEHSVESRQVFVHVPLDRIGESYSRFRLIQPRAEASMAGSMRKYGQISPVVVGPAQHNRYEMIDGFKRLRACRQLGIETLKATVLNVGSRALKAAIICLNWKGHSIADLEEAMVLHSLCRDDGLTQVEIAALVGRHKSWVCRRISMMQRLSDDVVEHIKLGLISATIGRELARLPRGNQPAALSTIVKYHLNSRETAHLVSILLQEPKYNHPSILKFPQQVLSNSTTNGPSRNGLSRKAMPLYGQLRLIERLCRGASKEFSQSALSELTQQDRRQMSCMISTIEQSLDNIKNQLCKDA